MTVGRFGQAMPFEIGSASLRSDLVASVSNPSTQPYFHSLLVAELRQELERARQPWWQRWRS